MSTADTSLNEMVHTALEQSPYFANRRLRFETTEGRVVLRGQVSSYYHKQMAQEILRRLHGVSHIENHLEVDWT
jgi:osmotically-inducible protein OsmY